MEEKMNEAGKIKSVVEPYVQGFGVDIGCGEHKIGDNAIGIDCRNLPCVTIKRELKDLKLFGDNQFDFVFSSHFLEHVPNSEYMLKEMIRILKKGGYLTLFLPDAKKYTENNPEHYKLWTRSRFKKIISKYTCMRHIILDGNYDYSYLYIGENK